MMTIFLHSQAARLRINFSESERTRAECHAYAITMLKLVDTVNDKLCLAVGVLSTVWLELSEITELQFYVELRSNRGATVKVSLLQKNELPGGPCTYHQVVLQS